MDKRGTIMYASEGITQLLGPLQVHTYVHFSMCLNEMLQMSHKIPTMSVLYNVFIAYMDNFYTPL